MIKFIKKAAEAVASAVVIAGVVVAGLALAAVALVAHAFSAPVRVWNAYSSYRTEKAKADDMEERLDWFKKTESTRTTSQNADVISMLFTAPFDILQGMTS